MRLFLTVLTYAVTLVVVAAACFVIVVVLAGPHSDILPGPLQVVVVGLGWVAVLALPVLAARAAWRRLGDRSRR